MEGTKFIICKWIICKCDEHVFAREALHLACNSFLMNLLLFFCETLFFWTEDDPKKLKTVKISGHKVSQMTSSIVHHLFLFFYGLIL